MLQKILFAWQLSLYLHGTKSHVSKEIIPNRFAKPKPVAEPYLCLNPACKKKKSRPEPQLKK